MSIREKASASYTGRVKREEGIPPQRTTSRVLLVEFLQFIDHFFKVRAAHTIDETTNTSSQFHGRLIFTQTGGSL
jgi:hypothetical protein